MKAIVVQVTPDSMSEAASFVEEELARLECDHKTAMKFMVAVDEIYSNIIYYSGADNARISVDKKGGSVYLIFSDDGKPYNPLEREAPDITLSLEERIPGGMGIFIVRNSMDEMTYRYEEGRNELTLVSKITQAE